MEDFANYDFYCYSSGCLSLVLAYLNTTVDDAFGTCRGIQKGWLNGSLSRYQIVDYFLEDLVPKADSSRLQLLLPHLNILLTTATNGVQVGQATNHEELVDLLVKTTWIPLVTGNGILRQDGESYIDGGFSRVLHPPCEHTARVPVTWDTYVNSLNPGFGRETAFGLWQMGKDALGSSAVSFGSLGTHT